MPRWILGNRLAWSTMLTLTGVVVFSVMGCDRKEQPPAGGQGGQVARPGRQPAGQEVREGESVRYTLAYPSGERETSSLLLTKVAPREVRVGAPYAYEIQVTNLTDQALTGVTVVESLGRGLQVVEAQPEPQMVQTAGQGGQQGQKQQQGGSQQGQAPRQQGRQQPQGQGQQQGRQQPQGQQQASQTQEQGGQQGQGQQQQEDQAQGQGGQQAAQQDQPQQQQPDQPQGQGQQQGRQQPQGQQQAGQAQGPGQQEAGPGQMAQWFIGELGPNETRTIRVVAVPTAAGTAGSCVAVSYQPTLCSAVQVVNPNLEIQLQPVEATAQGQVYICDDLTYQAVVRNVGTGVARNVVVQADLPQGLTTAQGQNTLQASVGDLPAGQEKAVPVRLRASDPREHALRVMAVSEGDKAYSNRVATNVVEPTLAVEVAGPEWQTSGQPVTYTVRVANTSDVAAREVVLQLDAPGLPNQARMRQVGDLGPRQVRTVPVTLDPRTIGQQQQVQLKAAAKGVCAAPVGDQAVTAIRRFPALLLETVDARDPVPVGETAVYTVTVKNQGDAPDQNVRIQAELPANMQFVGAEGTTQVQADGQKLNFSPIQQLPPGEVATWRIRANAQQAGDVRFRTALSSTYLQQPVPDVEPTRVIGGGGQGAQQQQQQQQDGQQQQQPPQQ